MKIQELDVAALATIRGGQGYFMPPASDAQSVWDGSPEIQRRLHEPMAKGDGVPMDQVPTGIKACGYGEVGWVKNGKLSCVGS